MKYLCWGTSLLFAIVAKYNKITHQSIHLTFSISHVPLLCLDAEDVRVN